MTIKVSFTPIELEEEDTSDEVQIREREDDERQMNDYFESQLDHLSNTE